MLIEEKQNKIVRPTPGEPMHMYTFPPKIARGSICWQGHGHSLLGCGLLLLVILCHGRLVLCCGGLVLEILLLLLLQLQLLVVLSQLGLTILPIGTHVCRRGRLNWSWTSSQRQNRGTSANRP